MPPEQDLAPPPPFASATDVSFEVFADDFASMVDQARTIATLGPNVNVKIPVTNTKGQSLSELLRALSSEGVVLNVTAIFTLEQVRAVADALNPGTAAIISVVRRTYRRYRRRPDPAHASVQANSRLTPEGAVAVGEHARVLDLEVPDHVAKARERAVQMLASANSISLSGTFAPYLFGSFAIVAMIVGLDETKCSAINFGVSSPRMTRLA